MVPAGGGMTEEQFYQHLREQKSQRSSKPRTVGLSPNHTVIHNQIAKVDVNFPNVRDGADAVAALEEMWNNPRSSLYTAGSLMTHPNIPAPMTTALD